MFRRGWRSAASQANISAARKRRSFSRLLRVTGTRNDGAVAGFGRHIGNGAAVVSISVFINHSSVGTAWLNIYYATRLKKDCYRFATVASFYGQKHVLVMTRFCDFGQYQNRRFRTPEQAGTSWGKAHQPPGSLTDAPEVGARAEEDGVVRHGGRREGRFAEIILGQNRKSLSGFQYRTDAGFVLKIEAAFRRDW